MAPQWGGRRYRQNRPRQERAALERRFRTRGEKKGHSFRQAGKNVPEGSVGETSSAAFSGSRIDLFFLRCNCSGLPNREKGKFFRKIRIFCFFREAGLVTLPNTAGMHGYPSVPFLGAKFAFFTSKFRILTQAALGASCVIGKCGCFQISASEDVCT